MGLLIDSFEYRDLSCLTEICLAKHHCVPKIAVLMSVEHIPNLSGDDIIRTLSAIQKHFKVRGVI